MITRALANGDIIAFSPPYVVTEQELETMIATARRALDEVAEELV